MVLNRLTNGIIYKVYPELKYGFRSDRVTAEIIFVYRKFKEKCKEQKKPLYSVYVDLTKAFVTVSREGSGSCSTKWVATIGSFHDGMMGSVFNS